MTIYISVTHAQTLVDHLVTLCREKNRLGQDMVTSLVLLQTLHKDIPEVLIALIGSLSVNIQQMRQHFFQILPMSLLILLTLSLPRVINFKFPPQPHQKDDTTHEYAELGFS